MLELMAAKGLSCTTNLGELFHGSMGQSNTLSDAKQIHRMARRGKPFPLVILNKPLAAAKCSAVCLYLPRAVYIYL
jgi:hypothetical protein